MEHPYKEYENTPIWSIVGQAITELVENNDIELQTPIERIREHPDMEHCWTSNN